MAGRRSAGNHRGTRCSLWFRTSGLPICWAGGQGAPLVSLLDYALFAHLRRGRVLQNIGGIANLTAIPAASGPEALVAFDTGPGNMVMDALALELFQRKFDRNGAIAAEGTVLTPALTAALRDPYFHLKPPRTAGREQFGRAYAAKFLATAGDSAGSPKMHWRPQPPLPRRRLPQATCSSCTERCDPQARESTIFFRRRSPQSHADGHAGAAT